MGILEVDNRLLCAVLVPEAEVRQPDPGPHWTSQAPPHPAEPQGFFLWAYQACCRDSQLSFTATLHPSPALPIVPLPLGQQARLSRREQGRAGPRERLTVLHWSYKPGMSHTINSPPSVLVNRPLPGH